MFLLKIVEDDLGSLYRAEVERAGIDGGAAAVRSADDRSLEGS